MSRFLDQLGVMASGRVDPLAARPVLASTMAQAAGFDAVTGWEDPAGSVGPVRSAAPDMGVAARRERAVETPLAVSARSLGHVQTIVTGVTPGVETAVPLVHPTRPMPVEAVRQPPVLAALPVSNRGAPLDQPAAPMDQHVVPLAARPSILPAPAPAMARPSLAAPLSAAAVAGRVALDGAQGAAAPVIHVTIDRIDVRDAVVAKPVAPDRRARQHPAVSLAEYLSPGKGAR